MGRKCSTSGCHDGNDGYIPTLVSFGEVQSNASDMVFQINNGAMPPKGYPALTAGEKAYILCWIQQGAESP